MPKIFILVTTFNRLAYTRRCLAGLAKQTFNNFQIIIIDGGSTDGTQEYLKKCHPETILIQGPFDNTWWWTKCMYEGVKLTLRLAKANDHVLTLNNDCFVGKNYLTQILTTAKKYPRALISSLCVRDEKPTQVVEAGVRIDWPAGLVYGVAQTISNQISYFRNMEVVDDLDALPGKGTLIPVAVYKKIGNYEVQKLPHYIADYEFTSRAKKAGYQLLVDTRAIVKHHFEATGEKLNPSTYRLSFKKGWNLLFGQNSMNNINDWVNFLYLACPKQYLRVNLYYTFWRLTKGIGKTYPFYLIAPYVSCIFKPIVKTHHLLHLILYRLRLFIEQFPEYHFTKKDYYVWDSR